MSEKPAAPKNERETGMMVAAGIQGVGKTYRNMHIIKEYIKDKFYNKVKGRKCLIFDTNGEYTKEQFARNDIENINPRVIAVKDIPAWSRSDIAEVRRIDAKNISIDEKIAIVEYIVAQLRNSMLVLEDINTYILNMTHMKDIVSGLVNLRHRAVDVLISYQSARPVEPRIWQNARWVRMHYQADNVNDIKGKLPNVTLFKLAQIIVNNRYFSGDKRFYVYVHSFNNKIEGQFTKLEFKQACIEYLGANKKLVKEHADMKSGSSFETAKNELANQYFQMYYGNRDK